LIKRRALAEVQTLDRKLSISVHIKNRNAATDELAKYIADLARLPNLVRKNFAQIVPDAGEEIVEEIFEEFCEMYVARSVWLTHLIFNRGQKTPEALKYAPWKHYEPDARVSESYLKLIEGLYDRSEALQNEFKSSPAEVWFFCEIEELFESLKQSGLGFAFGIPLITEKPTVWGERDLYNYQIQIRNFLEDPGVHLPPESIASGTHLGITTLISHEIVRLAYNDDDFLNDEDFLQLFWKPHQKIKRWASNKIKNDKHRKVHVVLPDGGEFLSGKGRQLPLSSC
jgi:hypothetical protein